MEIKKDVYKISWDGNVYLILKPVVMLIDTGRKSEREDIKEEIERIIPLNKIKIVLLTHLHYDHSGNIDLFENAELYASKEEIEDFKKTPIFFGHLSSKKLKNKLKNFPKEIQGLEVIKVPGHTRGSVAFVDKRRKFLFSGDTLFDRAIGRTDLPNSVPSEMKNSLKKLNDLIEKFDLKLCAGHDY